MFETCPICRGTTRVRMLEDWQDRVNVRHEPIPVVGCGNPWHYDGVQPLSTLASAEEVRVQGRCSFVYSSRGWDGGVPCPFRREHHPMGSHEWLTDLGETPEEVQEREARDAYLRPIVQDPVTDIARAAKGGA